MKFEDRMYMEERKGFRDELLTLEKRLMPQNVSKRHDSLTKTITYHLKKIRDSKPGDVYDWNKVISCINELVEECGVSPTSDEIKDFLRPFSGEIPEEAERTGPFLEAVQEVELETDPEWSRFFGLEAKTGGLPEGQGEDPAFSMLQTPEKKVSNAVRKVRRAFKGSKMVFVGGQPKQPAEVRNFVDIKALRAKALYDLDKERPQRKSHENPDIIALYDDFLGEPGSHKAHALLHTSYITRPMYNDPKSHPVKK